MLKLFLAAGCIAASAAAISAELTLEQKLPKEVKKSSFHGFDRYDFKFDGADAILVSPKKTAAGKPWIWRARFFGHQPQTDNALLNDGFHVAYIDVSGLFGAPVAVKRWDRYYDFLVKELGFSPKPVLEGMSRGGLIIFNWAKQNPGKVAAIYADAPVCDFNSWPGGKGKGSGSKGDYKQCLNVYGLTEEQAAAYKDQPKDNLEKLAGAGVPVLAVCGATDTVVPMNENIDILAENYRKSGGKIRVIAKPGNGHHPHSLKDPSVIVNFLKANAVGENDFINPRGGLKHSMEQFGKGRGTVAFLGGSITEMNGYTKSVEEGLKRLFPKTEFTFINAGISSTCSDTGAFRLGRDVLGKGKIDLLFVEFAVNDNQDGRPDPARSVRAMEGIVRQAKKANPAVDLVFLYTANESHLANYGKGSRRISAEMKSQDNSAFDNTGKPGTVPKEIAAHEKVAGFYGVPSVNFAADVQQRMQHAEFDWKKFGGVHPAPFGAAIYADDILCLLKAQKEKAPSPRPLPDTLLDKNSFVNGKLLDLRKAELGSGWRIGVPDWNRISGSKRGQFLKCDTLYSETPGSELSLDFTGTAIGIYLTAGPDAGKLEYKIDASGWQTVDLFHGYSSTLHYPYTILFAENLKPGGHKLRLKLSKEKNPRSKGTAARIMAFTSN